MKRIVVFALIVLVMTVGNIFANGKNAESNWKAPDTAKTIQNPFKGDAKAIELGKKIFAQQCATCHGSGGKGDGPAGKYLGKKLPDFTSEVFAQQTDGEIFWKVTNGNAPMPTFKEILTEEQRWQVVNYIRTLSSH
jgi:mono/diheme cytochrome c family protein